MSRQSKAYEAFLANATRASDLTAQFCEMTNCEKLDADTWRIMRALQLLQVGENDVKKAVAIANIMKKAGIRFQRRKS